jgi:hypothetical protein
MAKRRGPEGTGRCPPARAAIAPRPASKDWTTFSGAGSPAVDFISCRALQGKTTLALQFLLAGSARNERGLLISLSETEEELRATAFSHDWSLDSIHVHDVSARAARQS